MARPDKPVNNSNNKFASSRNPAPGTKTAGTIAPPPTSKPAPFHAAGNPGVRPGTKVEFKPGGNSPSGEPTRAAIAEAAYFLWLQRGGNETANWLEAETSLRRKIAARG